MILQANGEPFQQNGVAPAIVTADGAAYTPPTVLAQDEFEIIAKAFGINRRSGRATRNEYRAGKLPDTITHDPEGKEERHTHPLAHLLNSMASDGIVALYMEPRGLSKKALRKMKEGDLSGGRLCARVTEKGKRAFLETIRQARAAMEPNLASRGAK